MPDYAICHTGFRPSLPRQKASSGHRGSALGPEDSSAVRDRSVENIRFMIELRRTRLYAVSRLFLDTFPWVMKHWPGIDTSTMRTPGAQSRQKSAVHFRAGMGHQLHGHSFDSSRLQKSRESGLEFFSTGSAFVPKACCCVSATAPCSRGSVSGPDRLLRRKHASRGVATRHA